MIEVVQEAVRLLENRRPYVLATVVRTKGSTPQKPGAKLLVREDGSGIGTLGGGCIEGDVWFAAKEMLRDHKEAEFKSYYLNGDIAAREGLVCGGTMNFFVEPIWKAEYHLHLGREQLAAYNGGYPVSLATVVNAPNQAVQVGAKILIRLDGSILGSLGNPEIDVRATKAGLRVADLGQTEDFITKEGIEVFVEGFTTPPTVVIIGAGHVGKATADLAHTQGFRVVIVDDRTEFSNLDRFPYAQQTVVSTYDEWTNIVPVNVNTFIVVATRGHRYDDMALESSLATRAKYIGLLGSRRKTLLIFKRLLQRGIPIERLLQSRAPIGLDIGATTPEELALSIMSEIVMARRGGKGGPMAVDSWYLARMAPNPLPSVAV
jgi:xanthine dehydrogenase accessory factor